VDRFSDWLGLFEHYRAGRSPPIIPDKFAILLDNKHFTNRADKAQVADKYKETFEEVVGKATSLYFIDLGWSDDDAVQLAEALPLCLCLEHLALSNNSISARGAQAVAKASSKCSLLHGVDFSNNNIDQSTQALIEGRL